MDRKFPVIVILQGGLNALLFYLPVILVARILDLLVYRENSADPVSIAVVGLVGIWLLKGVKALLEKEMKTRSYQIAMRFETLVPVNTLNISFSDLESDYAKEMRRGFWQTEAGEADFLESQISFATSAIPGSNCLVRLLC